MNTSGLNNAGNNGYYWSSTPNSDGNNAYNLNFNSGNLNPSNNNNRYNGFPLRWRRGRLRCRSLTYDTRTLLFLGVFG